MIKIASFAYQVNCNKVMFLQILKFHILAQRKYRKQILY